MSESFDAIVVGAGAMGTAAARSLATRGRSVLVLERFEVGHALGSSGGPTRIFRLTYEHADHVRMARRALGAWRELEAAAGDELLTITGGIEIGAPEQRIEALDAAGERSERLSGREAMQRWPMLRLPDDSRVMFQSESGVCRAERTVRVQARLALELGATILEGTKVEAIEPRPNGAVVSTGGEAYHAPAVILTAGAWAAGLLKGIGIDVPLVPSLEQVAYFELEGPPSSPFPTVIDWTRDLAHPLYTVPDPLAPGDFKIGNHATGPAVDPDAGPFERDDARAERLVAYARERFGPHRPTGRSDPCLYTNTPDEDFVIDRAGPIVVGSPCSGQGFKFVPLIGEILADLAMGENPPVPLDRFSLGRDALRT